LGFRLLTSHQIFIEPLDNAGSQVDDLALADARIWRRFTAAPQVLERFECHPEQFRALALIEKLLALCELCARSFAHRFFASMTIRHWTVEDERGHLDRGFAIGKTDYFSTVVCHRLHWRLV